MSEDESVMTQIHPSSDSPGAFAKIHPITYIEPFSLIGPTSQIFPKRARKAITLELKLEIIRRFEEGEKLSSISKDLGLATSTVGTIRDNMAKIKSNARSVKTPSNPKPSCHRSELMEAMEKKLCTWIDDQMQWNMHLTTRQIREKAVHVFKELQEERGGSQTESFIGSKGWFARFKKRHGLADLNFSNQNAGVYVTCEGYSGTSEIMETEEVDYTTEPEVIITPMPIESEMENDKLASNVQQEEMAQAEEKPSKLWGGRFSSGLDPLMEKFNQSINVDKRLWQSDIQGSQAYANALCKAGLITMSEKQHIIRTLGAIQNEWLEGKFEIKPGDEDIHTANERRLKEICGVKTGGKLHTGRSRNDQVATDMRMWLLEEVASIKVAYAEMLKVITSRAKNEMNIIMPGYTHLQRAQPVRWSHWLMSHAWSFYSDLKSLEMLKNKINVMPLGSGALAGNPFNIDREALAKELGFKYCSENSMHAVGDRDFIAEFLFWGSLASTHFSKLAEDLIIFSTNEFGFVSLSDKFSTGSSLMPQKRNPDSLELIRGKSGSIIGKCTGFLTTLKGLPSTYNKDLQGDKEALFSVADDISNIVHIAAGVLSTMNVQAKKCIDALSSNMLATDVAYYLVRKGVPFRDAHELAGKVVSYAEQKECQLHQLVMEDFNKISDSFDSDVLNLWDYEQSVEQYTALGGTSTLSVEIQIHKLESFLR